MMGEVPLAALSVVIPTCRRIDALRTTLVRLGACVPAPAEVIIHVDAGDDVTAAMLAAEFPQVRCLTAERPQGPGGARNLLIREARYGIVVSLDDDSYPMERDFFARVPSGFDTHPRVGVLAMTIVHDGETAPPLEARAEEVADFIGCGCAYRRAAFLETSGYVPLHPAYGMEEADLALQLIDRGWQIAHRHDLRVRHVTDRSHQTSPKIVAAHIRNTALLAFLRYPVRLTGLGLVQVANRVLYSTLRGHLWGVARGLASIPCTLLRHRAARRPVAAGTVAAVRLLRRAPMALPLMKAAE